MSTMCSCCFHSGEPTRGALQPITLDFSAYVKAGHLHAGRLVSLNQNFPISLSARLINFIVSLSCLFIVTSMPPGFALYHGAGQ